MTGPASSPSVDTTLPLSVRGLTVAYNDKPALWNIDFDAPPAALVAIIGPNGAGKSSLIKAVLGLVPRLAGQVRVFGAPVAKMTGRIGYMPQRTSVDWDFPITALDVVAMGLYRKLGWLRPVGRRTKREALGFLEDMGLGDLAHRQIGQLSGGQQQRVFLARALAQRADLYFMDEPFAGVDATTEQAIVESFRALKAQGKTVIAVHHDLETVRAYFDHALVINVKAYANGPIDTALSPPVLRAAYGGRLILSGALDAAGSSDVGGGA